MKCAQNVHLASAHSPAMLDSEESETPASEEANTLACMAGGP
jgi:hypothetical protein